MRTLLSETHLPYAPPDTGTRTGLFARFVRREVLSPSIARVTFDLTRDDDGAEPPSWKAGEAVTLAFGTELDSGYAHMRDDDPQALNDDFVRTFTVSSPLNPAELQVTFRRKGPATGLLWRHNPRAELSLPVLGFGGADGFRMVPGAGGVVFVAGGVGITPLLAQASEFLASAAGDLHVLWGLRAEDLSFAEDSFGRIGGLALVTSLFVTGSGAEHAEAEERIRGLGARVERRRVGEGDLRDMKGRKFHVCAGDTMMKAVLGWLGGEDVVYESFSY